MCVCVCGKDASSVYSRCETKRLRVIRREHSLHEPANMPRDLICQLELRKPIRSQLLQAKTRGPQGIHTSINSVPVPQHRDLATVAHLHAHRTHCRACRCCCGAGGFRASVEDIAIDMVEDDRSIGCIPVFKRYSAVTVGVVKLEVLHSSSATEEGARCW
jgi:hypothetical protein